MFRVKSAVSSALTPCQRCRSFVSSSICNQNATNSKNNHQSLQNNNDDATTTAVQVPPPPSWSVSELRLSTTEDDKISNEELATLARRCLIDVRRLSPERRDKLRVHVGGIMKCASVLLDSTNYLDHVGDKNNRDCNPSDILTDEKVYDAPRGLSKIPIRNDRGNNNEDGDWTINDSDESKAIFQNKSVQSKMVKSDDNDDEMFFSVVTNVMKK